MFGERFYGDHCIYALHLHVTSYFVPMVTGSATWENDDAVTGLGNNLMSTNQPMYRIVKAIYICSTCRLCNMYLIKSANILVLTLAIERFV